MSTLANLRRMVALLSVGLLAAVLSAGAGPAVAACNLSSLRVTVDATAAGNWIELPGTQMRQVLLRRSDPEVGHGIWGATGSEAVIRSWNGAAFSGCDWYFHGGGHMNYGGNEVYAFNLAERSWRRLTDPTPYRPASRDNQCTGTTDVEKPVPGHVYDGIVYSPRTGSVFVWASSIYCDEWNTFAGADVRQPETGHYELWEFEPHSRQWTWLGHPPERRQFPSTAIDPETGNIVYCRFRQCHEFDTVEKTYTRHSPSLEAGSPPRLTWGTAAFDERRRRIVVLSRDRIVMAPFDGPTIGALSIVRSLTELGDLDEYGLAYDSRRDRFALWRGDGTVIVLHPETWETRILHHTGNAVPTRATRGVYSRWHYVAALDAFMGMDNADEGFWLYRLPVPESSPSIESRPSNEPGPSNDPRPSNEPGASNNPGTSVKPQAELPGRSEIMNRPMRGPDGAIVPSPAPGAPPDTPGSDSAPHRAIGRAAASESGIGSAAARRAGLIGARAEFEVPYSDGILSFGRYPLMTVGPGGDFPTCAEAAEALPRGGAGGVIEFLPGKHSTACGNLGRRGNILVTGRLGTNGERPRITTPLAGDERSAPRAFLAFNSDRADILVVQNLDIHDTGAALTVWNYGGMVMRNVRIDNTNGADAIKVNPTVNWERDGYRWPSWLEIYDSEIARGGSGNTRHNLYIGRIDRVLVDGLNSHSARGSHAFKAIARDLTVRNSTFATTKLNLAAARESAFLSTTLIDIAACARSLIERNRFVGLSLQPGDRRDLPNADQFGTSTQSFIDLKRRKTKVGGCDEPRYADAGRFDWEGAAAGGLTRDNPALFHHVIRNNAMINIGYNPILLVRNVGTAYVEDNRVSFTRGNDRPLPPHWFERAVAWLDDNTLSGPILPGEEWSDHPDYPHGAPVFVDGKRLGVLHRSAQQGSN